MINLTHIFRKLTQQIIELDNHASNLASLMNQNVLVTILLFTVKSKLSSPLSSALIVKGAMCPTAFSSMTLGLLYRGHTSKK